MNRNFGKLTATGAIEYAPNTLHTGDNWNVAPTAADYAAAGYLAVIDAPPSDPAGEGYHWEARGWEEVSSSSSSSSEFENGDNSALELQLRSRTQIRRVYERVADPPPAPRVFSKLKIVAALMEAGVWEQVKAYITEAGLYDLYLAAQDFKEDNPYFTQGKAALQTALGWTDGQVEAVLEASVIE